MQVDIYIGSHEDLEAVSRWKRDATVPDNIVVHTFNLNEPPVEGIPSRVLDHIARRRQQGLPLTLVDGAEFLSGRLPTADELCGRTIQSINGHSADGFTDCPDYVEDAAVTFPTRSRIHINIVVKDVLKSIEFYRVLLGQEPTKVREGYAKFETEDPPLNLALQQDPHGGAKPHFGIQVKSTAVIRKSMSRYAAAGFRLYNEGETACCFSLQDKMWLVDPEGRQWEVYAVMDNQSTAGCPTDCICYKELDPSIQEEPCGEATAEEAARRPTMKSPASALCSCTSTS